MNYKFLSICDKKIIKQAYELYLDTYLQWGSFTPKSFDEFKQAYTTSNDYEPVFAFFNKNEFIGYGLIMCNYMQHQRLDIGYCVAQKQRQKGFGTQICKELIRIAKVKYNPSLILADTFENAISEKVLLKNGFKKAGKIPNYNMASGKPRSVTFFYLELTKH